MSRDERAKGFIYVELLVSIALLGLVGLALPRLFIHGAKQGRSSLDLLQATLLADERAALLRDADPASLASGADRPRRGSTEFERVWTVELDQPQHGLIRVRVEVRPLRREGRLRPAVAAFLRTDRSVP